MSQYHFTTRLFLKQEKAKKDGTIPIYLRYWLNRKKAELSTGKTIADHHWNEETQKVVKSPQAEELNRFLATFKSKLDSAFSQLYIAGGEVTLEAIRSRALGEPETPKTRGVIDVMEEHNKHFLSLIPVQFSMGTYKGYKNTLKYLKEFIPQTYKKKDWPLEKVNYSFLEAYFQFLLTVKDCKTNGANKQIQRLKKVVNFGLKHGYIATNHTNTFSLKMSLFPSPI